MKTLVCDITLGGSTKQFLTYNKRNMSEDAFILNVEKALTYLAKTKPTKIARRLAALIGIIMLEFEPNERDYYLDVVITAFNNVERKLNK